MKRLALFAVAFTCLAGCDTPSAPTLQTPSVDEPSLAQISNEKFPLSGPVFNSCPPTELVAMEGWFHRLTTGGETLAGSDVTIHVNYQGVGGVGLTSGDRYRVIQNDKNTEKFSFLPPFPFEREFNTRFRLIRQGRVDNMYLRQTIRITSPPFQFEIIRSEIECRG